MGCLKCDEVFEIEWLFLQKILGEKFKMALEILGFWEPAKKKEQPSASASLSGIELMIGRKEVEDIGQYKK